MTNYTWNDASGDWDTASDWDPNGVPGTDDSATINGAVTIGASEMISVGDLDIASGGSVTLDGGLLSFADLANNGVLDASASEESFYSVNNTGGLLVLSADDSFLRESDPAFLEGGTIEGTLVVDGQAIAALTIAGATAFEGAGGVGQGTIEFAGADTGELTLESGATITGALINLAAFRGSELTVQGDATLAASTTVETGGVLATVSNIDGDDLTNDGAIVVDDQSSVSIQLDDFLNAGEIEVTGKSELYIDESGSGAFSNTGTISVGDEAFVEFGAPLTTAQLGTLDAASGANVLFALGLDNTGAIFDAGAGVIYQGAIDGGTIEGALEVGNSLALDDSPVFLGAGGTGTGTVYFAPNGGYLVLGDVSGKETIANVTIDLGKITNTGESNSGSILVDNNNIVTLAASTTINIVYMQDINEYTGANATLINDGTINISDGNLQLDVSNFQNAGVINVDGNLNFGIGFEDSNIKFTNTGIINVDGTSTIGFDDQIATSQLQNIALAAGAIFNLHGGLENAGATFDPTSGVIYQGTIDGGAIDGVLDVNNLTLSGALTFAGAGGVGAGKIILRQVEEVGYLDFASGGTLANVDIDVESDLVQFDAPTTFAASVEWDFDAGQTMSIRGDGPIVNQGLMSVKTDIDILSADFTNSGEILFAAGASLTGPTTIFDDGQPEPTFIDTGSLVGDGELFLYDGTTAFDEGATVSLGLITIDNITPTLSARPGPSLAVDENLSYAGDFTQYGRTTLDIAADDTFTTSGNLLLEGATEGGGTLDIAGGAASFDYSQTFLSVANWRISNATVTLDELIGYEGMFTLGTGATMALLRGDLDLSGTSYLLGGTIDGVHDLDTKGATWVSGLTLGGAVIWANGGDAQQYDDGLTLADEAILFNAAGGVYNLTGDSGVALGASATGFINNAGTFERAAGPGVSDIAADVYNTGEMAIAGGAIDLLGGLGGTGHIDVFSGGALDFGGAASTFVYTRNSLDLAAGATLSVNGGGAGFAGAVAISGASLEGAGAFVTFGATAVSGAAVGGTLAWMNAGTATQSGDDVALGAGALLFNTLNGVYDIADDAGVSGSGLIFNKGLFAKTGGAGTSVIAANMYNSGTIEAESGALDFQGALWGPGQVEVGAGATVEIGGVAEAAVDVAFAAATGTIALDDFNAKGGSLFFGTISGFGADDVIDIGMPYGAGTAAVFAENAMGTGGALTLTDGALTAHIAFAGVYASSSFAANADGHGGTALTFV